MVMHTCSAHEDHVTITCIVCCPQISKVIRMLVRWRADGPDSEAYAFELEATTVCVIVMG